MNDHGLLSSRGHPVQVGSLVEGRALDFGYGRRPVFRSCDFQVPAGVVGVLGPAGAGKTTLLELVVTRRTPAGGELIVLGRPARGRANVKDLRRRIGFLPQSFGFHPGFTVTEFVEYCGWLKQVPSARLREQAAAALESVELDERADTPMGSLSAEQLRRVGIAQALVHGPELLVLDEPTVGLDPAERIPLRGLIRRLAKTISVVVSTPLVEDVRAMCSTVMVLDAGRFAFTGPWPQLERLARPDVPGDSSLERGYTTLLASAEVPR